MFSHYKKLQDTLIETLAENERLSDINQAQCRFLRLESRNTWRIKIGDIMAQALASPVLFSRLPFTLYTLWKETRSARSPRSLGGTAFGAVLAAHADGGFEKVEMLLANAAVSPAIQANAYTALSRHLMEGDPDQAYEAARRAYEADPRIYRRKWLAFRLYDKGDGVDAEVMLNAIPAGMVFSGHEAALAQKITRFARNERLFSAYLILSDPVKGRSPDFPFPPRQKEQGEEGENFEPGSFFWASVSKACRTSSGHLSPAGGAIDTPQKHSTNKTEKGPRIACILNDLTFRAWAPECQIFSLTPLNATKELEDFNPELLFVESSGKGKDQLWDQKLDRFDPDLNKVLAWCRKHQVPTVFWNSEDPVQCETFLKVAQVFDFVFTTDMDAIAHYKAALGHDRVYLLPFACQPRLHNPVEQVPQKDAFGFSEGYDRFCPERTADLDHFLVTLTRLKPIEIIDPNIGTNDADRKFPEKYKRFIVSTVPSHEIYTACKGYRYAIHLNAARQSQTRIDRSLYEYLGTNTLAVGGFSRSVRLCFGETVVSSDNGDEIVRRLETLDESSMQKLRLAGLRKVMGEHCYAYRMQYVLNKVLGWPIRVLTPAMVVLAVVRSKDEYEQIQNSFSSQNYTHKRLLMILQNFSPPHPDPLPPAGGEGETGNLPKWGSAVFTMDFTTAMGLPVRFLAKPGEWLAVMAPEDYYGPNYLLDIALATRYSPAPCMGKKARYQWTGNETRLLEPELTYCPTENLLMRCSAVHSDAVPHELTVSALFEKDDDLQKKWHVPGLAIDAFNYCQNGNQAKDINCIRPHVDDLPLDTGLSFADILKQSETITLADVETNDRLRWDGDQLYKRLKKKKRSWISFGKKDNHLCIHSILPDGQHDYIYAHPYIPIDAIAKDAMINTCLDVSPGLDLRYALIFFDKKKNRLGHVIHPANKNCTCAFPEKTAWVQFGLRIGSGGQAVVKNFLWQHRRLAPERILHRSSVLLLTHHYPSDDDLYRNAFVHRRVKLYKAQGVEVDVFRFRPGEPVCYHEFQNVDVITGGEDALHHLLGSGGVSRVLVHFLSPAMWTVLRCYPHISVTVWVHGSEIQPWYRRAFNYPDAQALEKAKHSSQKRMQFWKETLNPLPSHLGLVFVSRYLAEEVIDDLGFRLPEDNYTIIHNPIDTTLFGYHPKPVHQRMRILSIRPYASPKYANDLTVQAILELSTRPFFHELEFRLIGDGKLFDETVKPVLAFPNVRIERRFVTQTEMALLYLEYGVFLNPTRWDSQGVSRDEAMACGLVPITNKVSAIPEFVDERCGFLADPEDACGLASAIERLYENPTLFTRLSCAAAERVRRQSDARPIIEKELEWIRIKTP